MTHIAGKSGFVSFDGGTEVTGIRSWSIDYTVDALETTDFADDGVKTFVAGGSGWSGTCEGPKSGKPLAIIGSIYSADFGESDTSYQHWTGDVLITGLHPSVSFDGVVTYSWDFQGTGALAIATA